MKASCSTWSFQAGCCFEFEFGLQICTGTLVPSISVFVLIKLCTCCSRAAGGSFSITATLLATKAVISPPIQQHWRDYLSIFKNTADWKSLCYTKQSWPREPHATLFPIIIHVSLEKRWNGTRVPPPLHFICNSLQTWYKTTFKWVSLQLKQEYSPSEVYSCGGAS